MRTLMLGLCNRHFLRIVKRWKSRSVKVVGELPNQLHKDIEAGVLKPRHHPGIIKSPFNSLPQEIDKAIEQVIGDTPLRQLLNEGKKLTPYLECRQLPLSDEQLSEKRASIHREVEEKLGFNKDGASEEEIKHYQQVVNSKVVNKLKQQVYNWKSLDYGHHLSLVYLISRGLPEYVVLTRVFNELKKRVPDFQPTSLFDFGSGVGTAIWAAESIWKDSVQEYFCVDTSASISDLSAAIISKSGFNLSNKLFHRQFLPASQNRKYDLVVSAYSLMELSDISTRLKTLLNLWQRTNKYLVLVERASNAYFRLITEARDFILMNSKNEKTGVQFAHIVAPCPHELSCPRLATDNTPCNFTVSYQDKYDKGQIKQEFFSYLIMAKGERRELDKVWPRLVRPVLLRSRHTVCKLCTSDGTLQTITFSPTKPNRETYRCAKVSKWGDLLPVDIKYVPSSADVTSSSSDDEATQPSDEERRSKTAYDVRNPP